MNEIKHVNGGGGRKPNVEGGIPVPTPLSMKPRLLFHPLGSSLILIYYVIEEAWLVIVKTIVFFNVCVQITNLTM